MNAFVPWPLPAAIGVALGAASHAAGLPSVVAWTAGLASAAAAPLAWRRGHAVWLLVPLLLPFGHLRHAQREARPAPLAPLAGRTVELAGRSDGRLLALHGLPGTTVALRPSGAVPRGAVRVRGRLEAAAGPRNPGGFDELAWLRRRGAAHVLRVEAVTASPPRASFRDRVRAAATAGLPADRARLTRALILGERDGASDLQDAFAAAGLAHLLALSGLHLGVLAGALGVAAAPLGSARWVLVAVAACAFAIWIGPTPSLIRAAAMTAAAGLSAALGAGRPHAAATLGLAATGTLLARPDWLADLAFQLSYLSLAGILALGAPAARRLAAGRPRHHPRVWLGGGLAVSVAATLAGVPWVVDAFGQVPVLGPLVNLPALPLTAALVPMGLAAGFLGALAPPLAGAFAGPLSLVSGALLAVAEVGALAPSVAWGSVGPTGQALWILGLAPWAWAVRGALRPWRAALVTAVALGAGAAIPGADPRPELVVLDVGQGDAILLRLPDRTEILVDGGGTPFSDFDVAAARVVPALRALDVDDIELVIATHPDTDHVEGLATVLRAVPVAAVGFGHGDPGRPAWRALVETARAEGVPMLPLRRGNVLRFGRAELHVLHPGPVAGEAGNDASVALRVDWRGRPWALLLGDVSSEVEARLAVPPVDVLVAAHHGSPHSTSARLLRAASPRLVAVSVGRNGYGHPAPDVLARVRDAGAELRRTDLDGAIRARPAW